MMSRSSTCVYWTFLVVVFIIKSTGKWLSKLVHHPLVSEDYLVPCHVRSIAEPYFVIDCEIWSQHGLTIYITLILTTKHYVIGKNSRQKNSSTYDAMNILVVPTSCSFGRDTPTKLKNRSMYEIARNKVSLCSLYSSPTWQAEIVHDMRCIYERFCNWLNKIYRQKGL